MTLGAAGGTFDSNGFTMTLGDLDGPGGFTKRGAGTLVVDGTSRYGGSTIVEAGTLRVARSTALPSTTALSINGAAVVDASGQNITVGSLDGSGSLSIDNGSATVGTNNASTLFAGSITGSGSLVKTGAGTLTLTGPNTYSGGTFVNAGALVGTSASLHGVITNDSLVGFAQTDSGVFTGTISGTGAVVKTGAGTLTFARPQLTTGLTEIAAGQLNVTGLAGSALVDTDATLSGSGTIAGSVTVNGTLTTTRSSDAPALTIGGNLLFGPSARFVIQARETGANLLQVNGRTTIDGTHLTLVGLSSTLPRVSTLPFLTSLGGVTGEFGKVDASVPVDALVTSRGPTSFLILERTDIPLASLATTANARSAGAALDAARATASGDLRAVIREVGALSDPDVNGALAQLGGSAAATALRTGALDAEDVLRSVSDRLVDRRTGVRSDLASPSSGASNGGHGMSVWFRATGRGLSGDAITSDLRLQGGLLGVDQTVANGRWLVGAFGGYDRAALTLDTGMNGLHDRRYRAGAYATTTVGTGYIDAAVAGAVHRFETTRHVTFVATLDPQLGGGPIFGGIDRSSTARYDGRDVTGFVESGIGRTVGRVLLQPFVGLDASRVSSDGFTERGASSIDLVASSATAASLRGAIGIRAARSFDAADGGVFAPRVEVRYLHELLDPTAMVPVAFAEAPTSPFTVTSATYGAHAVAASAGFVVSLSRQLLLSAQYRAVFASVDRTHAITLGVAF